MADINTAKWQLLPICTSLNGRSKSAPIVCQNETVKVVLEPSHAPFGAGNFNKEETVRLNLDISCNESYLSFCEKVDQWALKQLAKDTKMYFKKQLSEAELKAAYRPCATPHTSQSGVSFPHTIRLKIMTSGPNQVRCWTKDREPRPLPEDWRNCTITPQATVKSIWLHNGQAGVLCECTDVIVVENDVSCPF